jgi:WXG100 family type VII secretion target
MSSIVVPPQELRDHASAIAAQAQQAQSDFAAMKARLEGLATAFQGQASSAFQQHWNDWHTSATGLVQALEGLGNFLRTSADVIEETDRQLASGINQG